MFPALRERPQPVQLSLIQLELNLLLLSAPSVRLNKISSMVPDEPDLLRHVTQLDVRDNRLTDLDASVFPRLEVLHCERNRIASLKAKGCLLKGIYASNNGELFWHAGLRVLSEGKCVWLGKTAPPPTSLSSL